MRRGHAGASDPRRLFARLSAQRHDRVIGANRADREHAEQTIRQTAERLAGGTDPGVIPARFLIGAARSALDRGLARPGVITKNFYTELARR